MQGEGRVSGGVPTGRHRGTRVARDICQKSRIYSPTPQLDTSTHWHLTCMGSTIWLRYKFVVEEQSAEGIMLSHCANLQCLRPFLRLGQGKLFLVETDSIAKSGEMIAPPSPRMRQQPRRLERYWLCDQCAEVWTLVHDRHNGISLVALPRPPVSVSGALPKGHRVSA